MLARAAGVLFPSGAAGRMRRFLLDPLLPHNSTTHVHGAPAVGGHETMGFGRPAFHQSRLGTRRLPPVIGRVLSPYATLAPAAELLSHRSVSDRCPARRASRRSPHANHRALSKRLRVGGERLVRLSNAISDVGCRVRDRPAASKSGRIPRQDRRGRKVSERRQHEKALPPGLKARIASLPSGGMGPARCRSRTAPTS